MAGLLHLLDALGGEIDAELHGAAALGDGVQEEPEVLLSLDLHHLKECVEGLTYPMSTKNLNFLIPFPSPVRKIYCLSANLDYF